jgi:hypothetical protein
MADIGSRKVISQCDLGGQPDLVAISKDSHYIAVAIENERDEDLNNGELPQQPAGYVMIVPTQRNKLDCGNAKKVDLLGLADVAGSDPEPEFVTFNGNDEIALTLQENNYSYYRGQER